MRNLVDHDVNPCQWNKFINKSLLWMSLMKIIGKSWKIMVMERIVQQRITKFSSLKLSELEISCMAWAVRSVSAHAPE